MPSSSVVVVIDPEGKVLFLRRSGTDKWMPGHWNFPGGRVDGPEKPCEAATRELFEEANIQVSCNSLYPLGRFRDREWKINAYFVKLGTRPLVASNDGEHDAFVWTSLNYPPSPVISGVNVVRTMLADLLS